ncbi:histone deacetylase [Pseudogymnoascus destructans]|uniref:histone deacetylase n=1 Tax=Pseudogymnoascus destructans TaxID=655981 RepID=A0A177AGF1_9PEZI|nr:histone deacetylase [Pseudogymnoascus destructans]OAF61196.1 histone deacetylase [Pseudogymnoascus destructans]
MSSKSGSYPPLDLRVLKSQNTKRISYYYDEDVANHYYREDHPMEPQRIKMTHSLIMHTGIYKKLSILRAKPATADEMKNFHADEYVDFLERVTPETVLPPPEECFGLGENDCPAFEEVFRFSAISAAGSLEGAAKLGLNNCDIAINWAGGLHHAMKSQASGFCYINDIVLGILELLRHYPRVLYIDIDVHHGDAVETAFLTTDRVMTASFHQYSPSAGFFPQTGSLSDVGRGEGRNFSVNFPLSKGIDDASYKGIFEPVIEEIMARFCPSVIVLQCGADSLNQDKLGGLNLSMRGHANCIEFVKRLSVPTLVLGGGGYTIRNVARTWAYETGVLVGTDLQPSDLPVNDEYYEYYAPDYKLDVCAAADKKNQNTVRVLEQTKIRIFENLRNIAGPPSVQIQDVPRSSLAFWVAPEAEDARKDADEVDYPDVRYTVYRLNRQVHRGEELTDSDDEDGITYAMSRRRQKDTPTKTPRNYRDGKDVEQGTYGRVALRSDTQRLGILEQMIPTSALPPIVPHAQKRGLGIQQMTPGIAIARTKLD